MIFVREKKTAGNYKAYAKKVLEEELKFTVNKEKTKLKSVFEGVEFLGFVIYEKWLVVNLKRIKRFKDKICKKTVRNAGGKITNIIRDLNPVIKGWINYSMTLDLFI